MICIDSSSFVDRGRKFLAQSVTLSAKPRAYRLLTWLPVFFLACAPHSKVTRNPNLGNLKPFQEFSREVRLTATEECNPECMELRTEFRYVTYVGKEIYCYWDIKKAETQLDYEALAQRLEQSITHSTTPSEYFRILREWASSFHDGHVNAMTQDDLSALEIYSAPIRVEVMAPATDHEKVIVVKVDKSDKLDLGVQSISVGDEIRAINGVDVHAALTEAAKTSASGSTERMRRFSAGRRLVDVLGVDRGSEPFVLTLATPKGETKTVTLARKIEINAKPNSSSSNVEPTGAENLFASILPGGVGYLRIDGFTGSQDEFLLDQAMDRLAGTKGLILDLRKNGGGDLSGDRILARLIQNEIVRYKRSERLASFIYSARPEVFSFFDPKVPTAEFAPWHDLVVKPESSKHYSKPVVALISPNCFSACDTFSAALKDYGLATFVGEPTGGGTGTPLVFDLPVSGLRFRYSVIRGQTPLGRPIEGVGTLPDLYVEPTIEDRISQKDSQLVKALEVLHSTIGSSASILALKESPWGKPVWDQDLGQSPTEVESRWISKISSKDEI